QHLDLTRQALNNVSGSELPLDLPLDRIAPPQAAIDLDAGPAGGSRPHLSELSLKVADWSLGQRHQKIWHVRAVRQQRKQRAKIGLAGDALQRRLAVTKPAGIAGTGRRARGGMRGIEGLAYGRDREAAPECIVEGEIEGDHVRLQTAGTGKN